MEFDDSNWPEITASFGPRLWVLGPVPAGADPELPGREAVVATKDAEAERYRLAAKAGVRYVLNAAAMD